MMIQTANPEHVNKQHAQTQTKQKKPAGRAKSHKVPPLCNIGSKVGPASATLVYPRWRLQHTPRLSTCHKFHKGQEEWYRHRDRDRDPWYITAVSHRAAGLSHCPSVARSSHVHVHVNLF